MAKGPLLVDWQRFPSRREREWMRLYTIDSLQLSIPPVGEACIVLWEHPLSLFLVCVRMKQPP